MRIIKYKCDSCYKELSNDVGEGKPHISLIFNSPSGWVANGADKGMPAHWRHTSFTQGIYQFCNEKCLADHFKKLAKDSGPQKP